MKDTDIPQTGSPERKVRTLLLVLDIGFLVALLLAPIIWLLDPLKLRIGPIRFTADWGFKPVLAPVLFLHLRSAVKAWAKRCGLSATGLWEYLGVKRLTLAVVSALGTLVLLEAALARIDFKLLVQPIVIRGEHGEDVGRGSRALIPDPILRWRWNPGAEFNTRIVNQLGFLDREVNPIKAPGARRVICMGCSCTGIGPPPYSQMLHNLLTNAPPTTNEWEAFNMGVHGYSSVQGFKLFEMRGAALEPDVVTIYFGWNDHWRSGYWPDSHGMPMELNPAFARISNLLLKKRLGQFFAWVTARQKPPISIRGQTILRDQQVFGEGLRVPQDEYVATLTRFVARIRAAGAIPVLLTAPRGPTLTPILEKNQQVTSIETGIKLHDEYVDLTRRVALEQNVPLIDLAEMLSGPESAELFSGDGIHPTLQGRQRIAEEIYRILPSIVDSDAWRQKEAAEAAGKRPPR